MRTCPSQPRSAPDVARAKRRLRQLVDLDHHRPVHDQPLGRALTQDVRQEPLGQPLAARRNGGPGAQQHELVVEPLARLDPGRTDELRRADRHHARGILDEPAPLGFVAHDELDADLAHASRQHAHGLIWELLT